MLSEKYYIPLLAKDNPMPCIPYMREVTILQTTNNRIKHHLRYDQNMIKDQLHLEEL